MTVIKFYTIRGCVKNHFQYTKTEEKTPKEWTKRQQWLINEWEKWVKSFIMSYTAYGKTGLSVISYLKVSFYFCIWPDGFM